MKKIVLYALIFVLGFVGVSLWSFWLIVRPPKIIINLTPENYGLKPESLTLKTKDGLNIAAWLIPKQDVGSGKLEIEKKSALVLIHGYPAEKADMLPLAKSLTSHFSILLFDMRYFGKSEGRLSTLGKGEQLDLEAALDLLESRGYKKIGAFGFSLGGATALMKSGDPRISAVAAYAPFSNLRQLGYESYARLWILKYPLVELISFWTKIFLDYDIDAESPELAIRKLAKPVLIIHDKMDDQISFLHALYLEKALAQNPKAEFYFPEEGGHGNLPFDFDKRILEFFEKSLQ